MAFRNSDYPLTGLGFATGQNSNASSETSLASIGPGDLAVYGGGGPSDTTVQKIDENLNLQWTNSDNTDRVAGLAVDETNSVYSAGSDNTVRKFRASDGGQVWTNSDHTDNVNGIGTNRSNDFVVSGGKDTQVRKALKSNGNTAGTFTGHNDRVNTLSVDSQGFVFSGSDDETVRKITPSDTQEWSRSTTDPVGDVAAATNHVYYGTRKSDKILKIDKETGTNVIWTNTDHTDSIREVQLGPDGDIYSGGRDDRVRRIDSSNGNEVWKASIPATVRDLTLDADGNVYVGANNDEITVLNGSNGNQIGTYAGFSDNVSAITSNSESVSGVAMLAFTVGSTGSISGPTTIDVGDTENYTQLFNNESAKFSVIKETDQSFSWSSGDSSILSVNSGDVDTSATGSSDGTADINQDFDDKYNTTSPDNNSLSVTVASTDDLANASYSGTSFDVSSEESTPFGVTFNSDGSKMFVTGNLSDSVHEYDLSTGFDLSTASFSGTSFDVSSEDGSPTGVTFNGDGSKMFVVGFSNNSVFEYDLTTGFDVSTASFSGTSFDVNSEDGQPFGVTFNSDGSKMFMIGSSNSNVYEYDLTTGFDLTTASFSGTSFDVSSEDGSPLGVTFNGDGSKMFMVANGNDNVYEYNLTTGFDLTTASFSGTSFDVSSEAANPSGLAFNGDGSKMFVVGFSNDRVYEYTL